MDTAEAIILMTIANAIITGLVGGIVIYTVQKKIDATLQKSLFEHQTKFARNYPKTLETIEGFHQKFRLFERDFTSMANNLLEYGSTNEKNPSKLRNIIFENHRIPDCLEYLNDHRLFLPSLVISEIEAVLKNIALIDHLMRGAIRYYQLGHMPEFMVEMMNGLIKNTDLEIGEINLEKPDMGNFVMELENEIRRKSRRLEDVYKLVAEAN